MASADPSPDVTVLVTGFGAFLDVKTNPSWEIVSRLPPSINNKGTNIRIVTHPEPLKAEYHHLLDVAPKLIEDIQPDAVIHIGLAVERDYFAIERGAARDGYHQFPDEARKVFTKAESKKKWGKSPDRLNSLLDIEDTLTKWRSAIGAAKGVDLMASDDVGSYVCGLLYYATLEHLWRKHDQKTLAVFMHVPPLASAKDLETGQRVTLGLVKAIAKACERKSK